MWSLCANIFEPKSEGSLADMNIQVITSAQNPKYKAVQKLLTTKGRKKSGLFILEGSREIERALDAGCKPHQLWLADERVLQDHRRLKQHLEIDVFQLPEHLIEKLVVRKGTQSFVVVFEIPQSQALETALGDLGGRYRRILVLEEVEKPGNLGAILRCADGAGVDAVVALSAQPLDVYHPHVIRASLGAVFFVPVISCTLESFASWACVTNTALYRADLCDQAVPYSSVDFGHDLALLLGSEAFGPSLEAKEVFSKALYLPMQGRGDSLNVSVAAGIFAYKLAEFQES